MKKIIGLITILVIIVAIGLILLSTGGKMSGIFLNNYTISEDGSVMTIKVGVASSMGYVRTVKVRQDNNKKYLTFYSTYGLNSDLGSKNEFQLNLNPSINEIYIYRGDSGYELILQKNEETNEWEFVR